MSHRSTVDVAVVGAGPVGLTAACVLQAAGVDVAVFDAAESGTNTSRAAVVHARTLEVLEPLDVTTSLLDAGVVVPEFTVRDGSSVLARIDFRRLPSAYPFTLMVPQSTTEQILLERLEALGGQVDRGHRVTAVTPGSTDVHLEVDREGHAPRSLRARYTIGADGTRSVVRESAGIAYQGAAYAESFLLADIELDWPLPNGEVQLFFSPRGLVVVAPLPGGHHRVVATVAEAPREPDRALVQDLLDQRGPAGSHVRRIAWGSRFRLQHRLAKTYRRGPILLAGDAAHAHSPAGGQGMNIGIQDAVDLASTLVTVLDGRDPESSLDDYTARRRPLARDVVRFTDRMTRAATLESAPARTARNLAIRSLLAIPAVRARVTHQLAELPPTRAERA